MNRKPSRPTAEELSQLDQYLSGRAQPGTPAPGEPGFPTGLAGDLLRLAEGMQPDPAFTARLELQLRQAAGRKAKMPLSGWLSALWQSFTIPERKTTMKRLALFALAGILLFAVVWATLPTIFPAPTQSQVALATPPTATPLPAALASRTPEVLAPTPPSPVAISFTPQPIPNQPPGLPSLAEALTAGIGGSGAGNLPAGLPVSLAAELPGSPVEVSAYYRLENAPLALTEAQQIADQWGLDASLYMPVWMQSLTPDGFERSYVAIHGLQGLSMWNNELSYTDLALSPVYGGHQYPPASLPPADQAVEIAVDYLSERGYLALPYQVKLDGYNYGLVSFHPMLDGIPLARAAAWVKITSEGQVGAAWVSRQDYQSVGVYPSVSAEEAWQLLASGVPSERVSTAYHPAQDGNPQYWGRVYQTGTSAHLFGAPTLLYPVEPGGAAYVQLNNLLLEGQLTGLLEHIQSTGGYIHAWGEVVEADGTRTLQLSGWEPFDEFSGHFSGTVRLTELGNFLELEDGRQLNLPALPPGVPNGLPLYAEGGLVGDTLEWFILQVHPSDEGQLPPDLAQAVAIVDKVELVYLAPALANLPPGLALDPEYRMLIPAWSFSGHIESAAGAQLAYQAYVQAASAP